MSEDSQQIRAMTGGDLPSRPQRATRRMKATNNSNDAPTAAEMRAAVEHIVVSSPFRRSPQLVAFLRFVVDLTLAGKAECIKSYTIGVEALGRHEGFDPQADPIVRVEAARMRRALASYYAGEGAGLPITIEIPLGSYVPKFRRRKYRRPIAILIAILTRGFRTIRAPSQVTLSRLSSFPARRRPRPQVSGVELGSSAD
jgi:hypothetical protein